MEKVMKIEGMMCGHCEARVKKCLEALPEVITAMVSHENGTAVITLNGEIADEVLVKTVEDQDYKVVSFDPGVMDTGMQKQIRETEKHVFDQVDQFISYKEEKQLVSPSVVAEQLIERYISDWKASKAREKRSLL